MGSGDGAHGWQFGEDAATAVLSNPLFNTWYAYRTRGTLPKAGGWYDQPLAIMHKIQAMSTVFDAFTSNEQRKGYDFKNCTKLQVDLIKWIENE